MPVTYSIHSDRNLLLTRCRGNTTLTEVLAHFDELDRDADCPRTPDVFLDLMEITSLPEEEQLIEVAHRIGRTTLRIQFQACAIVTDHEPLVERMQVFEDFAGPHFENTKIFRKHEHAASWLEYRQGIRNLP